MHELVKDILLSVISKAGLEGICSLFLAIWLSQQLLGKEKHCGVQHT
jgi:hypothetical protein